ncbi:unnamed protein product [Polarella glacialis]|uniref:Bestrophin homolog n=1 Tax=Polarella glacialis TaxID=89957 RepID=A0A813KIF1_POLGL|nr:unnamed protein product [Polarella glacialis]CAE8701695.1 unnamed protein product [Polarella glacialis]
MILYQGDDWKGIIFSYTGTVWPQIRVLWFVLTLYSVVAYLLASHYEMNFGTEGQTILTGTTAFLLIFRANTAYARYWQGRCVLSDFVSEIREFMLLSIIYIRGGLDSSTYLFHGGPGISPQSTFLRDNFDAKAHGVRFNLVRLSIALMITFKIHVCIAYEGYYFGEISGEIKWIADWDRFRLLQLLSDEEMEIVDSCIGIEDEVFGLGAGELRKKLARQFRNSKLSSPPENWPTTFKVNYTQLVRGPVAINFFMRENLYRNMNDPFNGQPWGIKDRFVGALASILGNILRSFEMAHLVVTTPVPLPYANLCKTLLFTFLLSLPFYVDYRLGWFANTVIPSIICLALLGIDVIATELENPFGNDSNDLDLWEQVFVLEREGMELLRQSGDMTGCHLFGWQAVPPWIDKMSARHLRSQLTIKTMTVTQVSPLCEGDPTDVPDWLTPMKMKLPP